MKNEETPVDDEDSQVEEVETPSVVGSSENAEPDDSGEPGMLMSFSVGDNQIIPGSENGRYFANGQKLVSAKDTPEGVVLTAAKAGECEVIWFDSLGFKQPPVKVKVK